MCTFYLFQPIVPKLPPPNVRHCPISSNHEINQSGQSIAVPTDFSLMLAVTKSKSGPSFPIAISANAGALDSESTPTINPLLSENKKTPKATTPNAIRLSKIGGLTSLSLELSWRYVVAWLILFLALCETELNISCLFQGLPWLAPTFQDKMNSLMPF